MFVAGVLTLGAMAQPPGERLSAEEHIALWKDVAVQKMQEHGIPASITLAQGCWRAQREQRAGPQGEQPLRHQMPQRLEGRQVYHDDDRRASASEVPRCRRELRGPFSS